MPSSLGGFTAEIFARRYPKQTAGLVFLDAANSVTLEGLAARLGPAQASLICLAVPGARFGLLRLFDPFSFRNERSEAAERSISRLYRAEPMQALCAMAHGLRTTLEEFRAAPPLPSDVPLRVLIHERPYGFLPARLANIKFLSDRIASLDVEWVDWQQRFASSSSRGSWSVVSGSAHLIASDQPHVVAVAVREMRDKIRIAPANPR